MSESNLWYHGKLSRDNATKRLVNEGNMVHGVHLIRDCSSTPGDYVLSLWNVNQVMHFQLHCYSDNKFGIQDGPIFNGLDSLLAHYKSDPDGLPCQLTDICPGGSTPPLYTLKYGLDTSLHKACIGGDVNVIRNLLDKNTREDINSRDMEGYTPLHLSCAKGDDEVVRILLESGSNVTALDAMGRSPTFIACVAGHATTLRTLILQGRADFHERSLINGYVPLHEVASRGFLDCVRVLLSFNASMHPRTIDGDTPRDLALKHGKTEVVEFLDAFPLPAPLTTQSQWLHQNLDRDDAVAILEKSGLQDGSFLVRTSTRCHGYHVLSGVDNNKNIFHYKIKSRNDRWFFIDDGPLFDTLPHLIDHYMQYADGLPMPLKKPVPSSTRRTMPLPPPPFSDTLSRIPPLPQINLKDLSNDEETKNNFNHITGRTDINSLPINRLSLSAQVMEATLPSARSTISYLSSTVGIVIPSNMLEKKYIQE